MGRFLEFYKSINTTSSYALDPLWKNVWTDLLNYYSGDVNKAENAINSSVRLHGKEGGKIAIDKMLAPLKAQGQSQRNGTFGESILNRFSHLTPIAKQISSTVVDNMRITSFPNRNEVIEKINIFAANNGATVDDIDELTSGVYGFSLNNGETYMLAHYSYGKVDSYDIILDASGRMLMYF